VTLVVIYCNDLTVIMLKMYKEAAVIISFDENVHHSLS
jgi:hypothetical protein